jgi:DNA primase
LKKFELGYAPDGKAPFTEAAQKQGYKIEFLEKTGLTIKRDDWLRDRFAGRVMFPVHNLAGRVIAFGGRLLKDDPKAAKYLNSLNRKYITKARSFMVSIRRAGKWHVPKNVTSWKAIPTCFPCIRQASKML